MRRDLIGTFAILIALATVALAGCPRKHPVVLFPGIFGSVLEGFADNIPSSVVLPSRCPRSFGTRRLWISAPEFLPGEWSCFKTYFALEWDAEMKQWYSIPGIEIQPAKFGQVEGVESLDPSWLWGTVSRYFYTMIKGLEEVGYVRNRDIFAASYDWRKNPNTAWLFQIKLLIENITASSGTRAVLISHSMGSPRAAYFVSQMTDQWRTKHIERHVAIAPAWMGAMDAVQAMFSGWNSGIPLSGSFFAPLARRIGSSWSLFPRAAAWPKGAIAVQSPSQNWTYSQLVDLVEQAGTQHAQDKLDRANAYLDAMEDYLELPGIPVSCIVSKDSKTITALRFASDIKKSPEDGSWQHPKAIEGEGDGTVPLESLLFACNRWASLGADVNITFRKGGHFALIKDRDVITDVVRLSCT